MRAAAREIMISIMALVLVIGIGFLPPKAAAQSDKYSKMAPVDQYMMERNAEILMARSAAPDSMSSDATILVLGRQGYETAVRGKNGFVCMVERSWMAAFDSPEFWNPKVRGAECLNRQAAGSILPIAELRMRTVMAGHSKAEIVSAVKAAFENEQLPDLESGNMVFMMSKSAYLYDAGDHNGPHLRSAAQVQLSKGLQVAAEYLLTQSTVAKFPANPILEGLRVNQIPKNQINVQLSYVSHTWTLGLQGRFVGNQFEDDQNILPLARFFTLDGGEIS